VSGSCVRLSSEDAHAYVQVLPRVLPHMADGQWSSRS
jgi:hypothetical protein